MKIILLISAGGVLGTLARYFSTRTLGTVVPDPFWATLAVNVTGAFAAGFCFILCKVRFSDFHEYFPVLFIGFLGAFTTFSTFALESCRYLSAAQYGKLFLNILLHNTLGLGSAAAGFYLAKHLFRG